MYKEILNRKNTNNIQMITDIKDFFNNSKLWNVINFRDTLVEPSRGKELFIERDNKHYSFSTTIYNFINIYGSADYLEQPLENSRFTGMGHFAVYLNSGYDQFSTSYEQPSNNLTPSNFNHMCSALPIPFSDTFNYRVLIEDDEYNFIIELEYNNFKFYLFFGDLLKGNNDKNGNPSGQFSFGSYNIDNSSGNSRICIQKDLYESGTSSLGYKFANNPFYELNDFNFYYYDNLGNLTDQDTFATVKTSNCGYNRFSISNYTDYTIRSINNDFFGIEQLINLELYLEETDDNIILLNQFNFGFLNDRNLNDKEILEINNEKYEILHFYYDKKDVLDTNNKITKGIAMFIKRSDI